MDGVGYVYDIFMVLDKKGVVVCVGIYCVMFLMEYMGVLVICCVLFGMYNIKVEVDKLVDVLELCYDLFV